MDSVTRLGVMEMIVVQLFEFSELSNIVTVMWFSPTGRLMLTLVEMSDVPGTRTLTPVAHNTVTLAMTLLAVPDTLRGYNGTADVSSGRETESGQVIDGRRREGWA